MKLVIDRKLWIRGITGISSALMVPDGRMCCLGFHALACGIPVDEIKPQGRSQNLVHYPYTLLDKGIRQSLPEGMEWLVLTVALGDNAATQTVGSADGQQLANINDRSWGTDEEREREIAAIFAKHDVEVEFIN